MMPHGCATMGAHQKHEEKSQFIGNKICPVSGQKIDEKTKVAYNYKGKTYNFCCTNCVEEFKKDPVKYINKMEQQLKNEQEHPSATAPQHSH